MNKKYLENEVENLNNYKKRLEKENYSLLERLSKIQDDFNDLERDNRALKKYVKTIQEYLCKGIFETIKKELSDDEDEFYED